MLQWQMAGNELEFNLSPEQTATAITTLRGMVNELWPVVSLRPRVIGPDLNPRPDWLRKPSSLFSLQWRKLSVCL